MTGLQRGEMRQRIAAILAENDMTDAMDVDSVAEEIFREMREPTPAMLESTEDICEGYYKDYVSVDTKEIWQTMIDAALRDG